MKYFFIFVMLILLAAGVTYAALPAVTNQGCIACLKKEWLNELVSFTLTKDQDSFKAYIAGKKCIALREGLKVTVTEVPGFFNTHAGFVFQGVKFWTIREALNFNRR